MAKSAQKLKAINLRRKGLGINEIARKINISKRTICRWCTDIKLTKTQEDKLWQRAKAKNKQNFKLYCERRKNKTQLKIKKLREKGIKEIGQLSEKELFLAGVALYWAEGFKKDTRLGFANSDPTMIKFFLKWLKNCKITKGQIRLRLGLNINHKDRVEELENYWSKITSVPKSQFNKPFFQKTVWKKKFEKPNDYLGVLRIRVNKSINFLRRINGWIEGLKMQTL